jgi:hypothetical protein
MKAHAMLGRILGATVACAAAVGTSGCEVSAYPDNTYVDGDYPPADYIATVEPVYFEGHAAYWYNNRWYYRDGARWGHYDHEPAGLAARRGQFQARGRVNYGRPSTRGGGGSRGGHR